MNEKKEKLIELVRQNECIYNIKHKDYKNVSYKNLVWQQIGAEIGIQGSTAKDMWRTLRDGYIRHKKTVKGQTGSSRKYSNYKWSSQMSFLDGSLELRPTGTNITVSQESSNPPQSPLPESAGNESPTSSSIQLPQSPPSPNTQQPTQTLQLQSQPDLPRSLPSSTPRTTKRKNDSGTEQNNTDKVLDYLRNKKKREWDSADYLFMSYAASFKELSVRKQGKIKVELAKLFADAELDEIENNVTNNTSSQIPSTVTVALMSSPTYTAISDVDDTTNLTQTMFFINDSHEQAVMDDEAIDLTNICTNTNHSEM